MAITDIKTTVDTHFDTYGMTLDVRNYPLAEFEGDFPHKDSNADDFPTYNSSTERGYIDPTSVDLGGKFREWTSDTGNTYQTSVRIEKDFRMLYLKSDADVSFTYVASSTANRNYNYGRNMRCVLVPGSGWFSYQKVIPWIVDGTIIYYEILIQKISLINWAFEYCFDEMGNLKFVQKIVPDVTDEPIILMDDFAMDGLISYTGNWEGITADASDDIWITSYGVDIYKYNRALEKAQPTGQVARDWYGICTDSNDDVWATVDGGDIYKLNRSTGEFEATGQTTRSWRGIAADDSGNVWALSYGGGIYKRNTSTGDFEEFYFNSSLTWNSITIDKHGYVYIALSSSNYVYRYNPYLNVLRIYSMTSGDDLATDSSGDNVLIADPTGNDGVYELNHPSAEFEDISVLDSYELSCVTVDSTDKIWAGVYNGSIYTHERTFSSNIELSVEAKWRTVFADPNDACGPLWACAFEGDIYVYNSTLECFEPFAYSTANWCGGGIDENGDVLMCINDGDVYKLNSSTRLFASTGQTSRVWGQICNDDEGNTWATANSGIYKLDASTYTFEHFFDDGGKTGWKGITVDAYGDVFVLLSTQNVYKYNSSTETFDVYTSTTCDGEMTADSLGNVFLTHDNDYSAEDTDNGGDVYKLNRSTDTFDALNIMGSGVHPPCTSIAADANDNLYVAIYNDRIHYFEAGTL